MSEAIAGIEAMPFSVAAPRDAAAVILYRRTPSGPEVFWLKREKTLAFAGGFFAFPGGKVDKADRAGPVDALIVAAARELFEETGVLVAHGAARHPHEVVERQRKSLLAKEVTFTQVLVELGASLDASAWTAAGRWLTPGFLPVRFDARFFLVEVPPESRAEVWPGELSWGGWTKPADALALWERGEALLHPPNRHALEVMAQFESHESAAARLCAPAYCDDFVSRRIEFQKGIHIFPLRTPTLPPATHTNAYVLGTDELFVVDPGSPDNEETDRLVSLLEEFQSEGRTVRAVVLTHHHGDHVGGVARLIERLKLPVWAHAETAKRVPWPVERLLSEGDALGTSGFRAVFTPGHAVGHLCFIHEPTRAAVVGDMVAGVGTIVIEPPEGDMGEYLAQLRRLKALPVGTIYPAHGPVIPEGIEKLDQYLTHRAWREQKVLDALAQSPSTAEALVPRAYDDVESFVWPLAERNTLAILEKLKREGRVRCEAGQFSVV